jgi:hypothetical protein
MGQTLATSGNHVESTADITSASVTLCRRALSWVCGLQQDCFRSARMQTHRTREAGKTKNLGSSRATWVLTWPRHASLPVSKCVHHDNGQRTHCGYSGILPPQLSDPQLSSTGRLLMASQGMTDAFQNPHPDVPFASVGDDTITALEDLAAIFKLKLQPTPSPASHASPPKVVHRHIHIPSPLPATR